MFVLGTPQGSSRGCAIGRVAPHTKKTKLCRTPPRIKDNIKAFPKKFFFFFALNFDPALLLFRPVSPFIVRY